jgi:hypothetical protein
MKPTKPIRVNRLAFIGWTEGDLLNFTNGKGYCNDHIDHENAQKALEHGETIELADKDGNVISTMVETKNGFEEKLIETDCTK